jgi:TfoX/Sxy family transcriptional regulator of competence genes
LRRTRKKRAEKKKEAGEPPIDPRFAPVAKAFAKVRDVSAGKLFSSYGLKVNGKTFAMFGRGRLVLKLPKDRVDGLMSSGRAERFEPGPGRIMKEWVALRGEESEWVELAQEAYNFVKQPTK